ncbi:hypothetical protein [Methanosarcina mazei]|uniref:Uncharacterized protein n=1 Tax=Methanosarcina mazei SarPi TaxID=1434115 RepID=A0A0E3LS54_METMZ|nr:hypothetical protein [Methanosarcina mazei]AKB61176.1 hypothetical protein MSMAP_1191 [Methanosarcina mazei SarPi]
MSEYNEEKVSQGTNNSNWISTVILKLERGHRYSEEISKEINFQILSYVICQILSKVEGNGIILFPAGWIDACEDNAKKLYGETVKRITPLLKNEKRDVFVCVGIDGNQKNGLKWDQIALAVDKNGIQALGRKFYPTKIEKDKKYEDLVKNNFAKNYLVKEEDYPRIFTLNGRRYYLSVCYDIFGLKKDENDNKDVDVILNLVHCFCPKSIKNRDCEEEKSGVSSGDSYYARHGFGGASKKWACPVFGAAVFYSRKVPERWPSGVMWNSGDKSTKYCNYNEISLQPTEKFNKYINECTAYIRIYCI